MHKQGRPTTAVGLPNGTFLIPLERPEPPLVPRPVYWRICIEFHTPKNRGVRWEDPRGGMYVKMLAHNPDDGLAFIEELLNRIHENRFKFLGATECKLVSIRRIRGTDPLYPEDQISNDEDTGDQPVPV